MRTVLQSVSFEACDLNDLNLLQVKVQEILSREMFLVVLDDVWNENYEKLTALLSPFEVGSSGSSIIVTTRNGNVASMMGTLPAYHLKEMYYDNCLSLFTYHALGKENFDDHPKLEVFGQEIVKKCKGLPLAAKALGGLLRRKLDWHEWENVLDSKIWDLGEEKTGILPAVRLSYQNLPSHLKQCFAYCAVFPKDYEFDKDVLIQLWIAEGFISQQKGTRQMEDIGSMYFSELISRSFYQQSSVNHSRYMNWLERFPEFKGMDFYITGEIYAGHYVPQLAHTILQNNKLANRTIINLKGIIICPNTFLLSFIVSSLNHP